MSSARGGLFRTYEGDEWRPSLLCGSGAKSVPSRSFDSFLGQGISKNYAETQNQGGVAIDTSQELHQGYTQGTLFGGTETQPAEVLKEHLKPFSVRNFFRQ